MVASPWQQDRPLQIWRYAQRLPTTSALDHFIASKLKINLASFQLNEWRIIFSHFLPKTTETFRVKGLFLLNAGARWRLGSHWDGLVLEQQRCWNPTEENTKPWEIWSRPTYLWNHHRETNISCIPRTKWNHPVCEGNLTPANTTNSAVSPYFRLM